MRIAVAREIDPEPRVAATPDTVKKLAALGAEIVVEQGAGLKSGVLDTDYSAAGATVSANAVTLAVNWDDEIAPGTSASSAAGVIMSEAFRLKLQDLGYIEGKNLKLDVRRAEQDYTRLPALAAELLSLAPDVSANHSLDVNRD